MAVMLSKTYDALVAAGVPEDKARAAAEELARYESRFSKSLSAAMARAIKGFARISACPISSQPWSALNTMIRAFIPNAWA
jgi:hypothetical protein